MILAIYHSRSLMYSRSKQYRISKWEMTFGRYCARKHYLWAIHYSAPVIHTQDTRKNSHLKWNCSLKTCVRPNVNNPWCIEFQHCWAALKMTRRDEMNFLNGSVPHFHLLLAIWSWKLFFLLKLYIYESLAFVLSHFNNKGKYWGYIF